MSQKRYRYTGKEKDDETGLAYHGARYYAPWLGRWERPDPAGMVDSLNRYLYASGNPVSFVDLTGQAPAQAPAWERMKSDLSALPDSTLYDRFYKNSMLAVTTFGGQVAGLADLAIGAATHPIATGQAILGATIPGKAVKAYQAAAPGSGIQDATWAFVSYPYTVTAPAIATGAASTAMAPTHITEAGYQTVVGAPAPSRVDRDERSRAVGLGPVDLSPTGVVRDAVHGAEAIAGIAIGATVSRRAAASKGAYPELGAAKPGTPLPSWPALTPGE